MGRLNISGGQFKHVIKFETPIKAGTVSGGRLEDYQEFYTARGLVAQVAGNRNFDTGRDLLIEKYDMWCYWRSALETNITKDTRVTYENKFFRIDRMERIGEKRQYYHFELIEAY